MNLDNLSDDAWIKHHREDGLSYDEIAKLARVHKLWKPDPFSWEAPPKHTDLSRWFSVVAEIEPSTCTDAIENQYPVYTLALYLLRLIADGEQSARPGALHANRIREDACDQLRYAGLFIRRHSSHDIWWYDIDVPAVVAWAVRVIKKYEDSQEEKWKVNHPMTTPTAERARGMIELRWYRMARFKTEHNETIYGEPVLQWREVEYMGADGVQCASEWSDVPTVLQEGEK